jgi:flagellar hook-associated protein 1 FlgK
MSNLLASLRSSTSALDAITEAVSVTQNNISNAGSAGYAKQKVSLHARDFDLANGLAGGVSNATVQSARDQYAERAVRRQGGRTAAAESDTLSLTRLEQIFQLSSGDSIPSALNKLFRAFSAWSAAPEDRASKENIASAGADLAASFRNTSQQLADLANDNANEIRTVVDRVNRLAGRIQEYNARIRTGSSADAGVDAGIYSTLDELSADVNLNVVSQEDGTYSLMLNGEHPLVIGTEIHELSINIDSDSRAHIVQGAGHDVTSSISESRLASLLTFRHTTLGEIKGDGTQQGELNRLAGQIVDRINQTWPPPAPSFFVSSADPGSTAQTIAINPALTPSTLTAVEPGPPVVANGKALQLAALANPVKMSDKIDGLSFNEFYGQLASSMGGKLNNAKFDEQSELQLSAQVTAFRDQISGVSLDEEALNLMQYQRAYEASARMVTVLDELLETAVNLGR